HTHSSTGQFDGWLRKFTIAPQIGAGRKFFSRPVLRAFLTYADWSDGLRGFVGGIPLQNRTNPFQNRTNGLAYEVQAETWWYRENEKWPLEKYRLERLRRPHRPRTTLALSRS